MKLVYILFFLLVQSLLPGLTNGRIINGFNLRSFTCLGMGSTSQEKCKVLGIVAVLPDRLLMLYKSQLVKIRNALDIGNLTMLKEHELASLDPILFLLIPENELAQVGGKKLAALLNYRPHEKTIARHILSAASTNENLNDFLHKVRTMELDNDILDMIGDELPLDADSLLGPLLTHLPFQKILNLTNEQKQKLLVSFKVYVNKGEYHWSSKKSVSHRIWFSLSLEESYPTPLHLWKDSDIETTGSILIGAIPSELRLIQGSNIFDKSKLFTWDFSTLQVRALFETLYEDINFSPSDFRGLKYILVKLLPSQLQRFSNTMTNFRKLFDTPHPKSIATSKQIVEFLYREGKYHVPRRHNKLNDVIINAGKMVYVLPLSTLQVYRDNPLSIEQLLRLQSEKLSFSQVYYLLGAGININVSSISFHEMISYLHALPTNYIHKSLDSYLISHLALNLPFENLPRLMKFLQFSSSALGSSKIFISILENPARLKIFDYFPHRILQKDAKLFIQILKIVPHRLFSSFSSVPNKLAPFILRNMDESSFASLKISMTLKDNLLIGLTCQDLLNLPTSDFIVIISRYRRLLNNINKEFPKELQHCSARKLVEYLKLKSYVRQLYLDDHIMTLLSPTEIEAVGGWILSSLPLEDILSSPHLKAIVHQIGSMSVSEILTAAPLSKIRKIIYNFLAFQEAQMEFTAQDIFFLGNLTMLLKDDVIVKIDSKIFKVLLEGSFFDTRICATSPERHAWFEVIQNAFGSFNRWTGEEIKTLGNLLIALPKESLNEIPVEAWIQVADVVEFGYLDEVQWYKNNTFFKRCLSLLPIGESESYLSSLLTVLEFYLQAAQFQLDTVKRLDEVYSLKEIDMKKLKETENSDEDESEDIIITNENENSLESIEDTLKIPVTDLVENNKVTTVISIINDFKKNNSDYEVSSPEGETLPLINNYSKTVDDTLEIQLDQQKSREKPEFAIETEVMNKVFVTESPLADSLLSDETHRNTDIDDSTLDGDFKLKDLTNENGSSPHENKTMLIQSLFKNQSFSTGQNLKDNDVLPDYLSALDVLENTNPSNYVNEFLHTDDLLHSLPDSENVFQPVNITGVITLSPPKVKLQDVLHLSDTIIYENLTHALEANRDVPKKITPVEDDMHLEPAMNSDEWDTKFMKKRSARHRFNQVSCDAMKMLGTGIQLLLTEDAIKIMSDQELFDCSEIFASVKLPEEVQGAIWSRLNKTDIHLKGHLLASAEVRDLRSFSFNISQSWVLETIFQLSRFNSNPSVMKYAVEKAFSDENVLRIEEVVSLGKLICYLPSLKDVLRPSVFLRASVVLGQSLTCNVHCLNILASIASEDDAYGLSISWSSLDFADLGIIVAGLSTGNWAELMKSNPDVLFGLQTSAAECLSFEHIEAIPKDELYRIPPHAKAAITEKLKHSNLEELKQAFLKTEVIQTTDPSTETSYSPSKNAHNISIALIFILLSVLHYSFNQNILR